MERLPPETCQCKNIGRLFYLVQFILLATWKLFVVEVMGTSELITTKIHVDHMIDSLARYCSNLERLEFRWDNETLR